MIGKVHVPIDPNAPKESLNLDITINADESGDLHFKALDIDSNKTVDATFKIESE